MCLLHACLAVHGSVECGLHTCSVKSQRLGGILRLQTSARPFWPVILQVCLIQSHNCFLYGVAQIWRSCQMSDGRAWVLLDLLSSVRWVVEDGEREGAKQGRER